MFRCNFRYYGTVTFRHVYDGKKCGTDEYLYIEFMHYLPVMLHLHAVNAYSRDKMFNPVPNLLFGCQKYF